MGEQMQEDEHALIESLLPWFVNGSLEAVEHDTVRRHLHGCEECRTTVSLLSVVQSTIRHATATPMVPSPRVDRFLENIDRSAKINRRSRPRTIMAASLATALLLLALLLPDRENTELPPPRYETAASTARPISMDYVLNVQFEAGIPLSDRESVLRGLEARDVNRVEPGTVYRVTVNLPAASLEELEQYVSDVESLPQVRSVSVVALQLPMKRQR